MPTSQRCNLFFRARFRLCSPAALGYYLSWILWFVSYAIFYCLIKTEKSSIFFPVIWHAMWEFITFQTHAQTYIIQTVATHFHTNRYNRPPSPLRSDRAWSGDRGRLLRHPAELASCQPPQAMAGRRSGPVRTAGASRVGSRVLDGARWHAVLSRFSEWTIQLPDIQYWYSLYLCNCGATKKTNKCTQANWTLVSTTFHRGILQVSPVGLGVIASLSFSLFYLCIQLNYS